MQSSGNFLETLRLGYIVPGCPKKVVQYRKYSITVYLHFLPPVLVTSMAVVVSFAATAELTFMEPFLFKIFGIFMMTLVWLDFLLQPRGKIPNH